MRNIKSRNKHGLRTMLIYLITRAREHVGNAKKTEFSAVA